MVIIVAIIQLLQGDKKRIMKMGFQRYLIGFLAFLIVIAIGVFLLLNQNQTKEEATEQFYKAVQEKYPGTTPAKK